MDDDDHRRTNTALTSKTEDDALVGNVNRVMITPPEHKGRPKQGHLIFNANFESGSHLSPFDFFWISFTLIFLGNLARIDFVSECEFDLFIRPDTCNPKQRVWFYFSVENVRAEQVS